MASPAVTPQQQGLILQRGHAELLLHQLDDRLTVAFRDSDVDLLDIVPGLMYRPLPLLRKDFLMQEVIVPPEDLETLLTAARQHPDILFASHVYQLAHSVDSFIYLTNQMTIQFADGLTVDQQLAIADRYGLEEIQPVIGIDHTFVYQLTAASSVNPLKLCQQLQARTEINLAEANIVIQQEVYGIPSDQVLPQQWYLQAADPARPDQPQGIDVVGAWEFTKGDRSIVVAVADEAIDVNHPDFEGIGKIVAPYDFTEHDFLPSHDLHQESHGTLCAGLAIAEETGTGLVGVAPECALMPLKTTSYIDDDAIEALFTWVVDRGADVILCNWNAAAVHLPLSLRQSVAIHRAATQGRDGKGCVIIFAAGNANRPLNGTIYERGWHNKMLYGPTAWLNGFATHPDAIAVSACTHHNLKAAYSNWGAEISVCAPSSNAAPGIWFAEHGYFHTAPEIHDTLAETGMFSLEQLADLGYVDGHLTREFGGTSAAAALVAGVAALMLSVNPMLTALEVKQILETTADKIVDPKRDRQLGLQLGNYDALGHSRWFGYGKVNAQRAVQLASDRLVDVSEPESTITETNDFPMEIPDDSAAGVTSLVAIAEVGTIKDIAVQVEIDHDYLGDLEISLRTADGQILLLQNRTLGNQTHLKKTYTPENSPTLQQLIGQDITGEWSLWVVDYAPTDTGTLQNWSLTFKY